MKTLKLEEKTMKKVLAMLLALTTALSLVACGSTSGGTPTPSSSASGDSGDGYELVMWMFSDATMNEQGKLFDKWRSDFLSQHPEVKSIEFVAKGDSELLTGVTAGVGLPDILMSSFTYGKAYRDAVDLLDLSDLYADTTWSDGFYADAVGVTNVDGGYWAIPFMAYVPLIWRNLDALEAAGVDAGEGEPSLDALLSHMQQVNDKGLIATHNWSSGGVYSPAAIMGADFEKYGNPLDIVDGKTTVEPTALTRTFEYILKFNEQGNNWSCSDDAAVEAFKSGEMAYLLGGPWDEPSWQQAGVNYDVVLVPPYDEGSNVYGGFFGWDGFYGINSGDEGKNEAIEAWLKYLGSFDVMKEFTSVIGRPTLRESVMNDAEIQADPVAAVQAKGMEYTRLRIDYFTYSFYWITPLTDLAVKVAEGSITPEEAAAKFVEELNALYADAGA